MIVRLRKCSLKAACHPYRFVSLRPLASGLLRAQDLIVRPVSQPKPKPSADASLPFGKINTDHMLTARWTASGGWEPPQVEPFRLLSLHPASLAFNHGQAVFEGMKAFAGADGRVRLFRPELNMRRLERSAQRMGFPEFDGTELLECIKKWLQIDQEWVPKSEGSCLYIRPVLLEVGGVIGGFEPTECLFVAFAAPSGSYFGGGGIKPISMMLDETNSRASKGGVGWCKHSGNYAPTFVPVKNARTQGCAQVLFTSDGLVGECAAMNVFFLIEDSQGIPELITPSLDDGTILPGVTRQSVLDLARDKTLRSAPDGMIISERPLKVEELKTAAKAGQIIEIFGTGTAVVVQPVEALHLPGNAGAVKMKSTSLGESLLSAIQDIQYFRTPHEWSQAI